MHKLTRAFLINNLHFYRSVNLDIKINTTSKITLVYVDSKAMFTPRDRFQTDPNGSGPKIGSNRPSVYTGPFRNWSANGSKRTQKWTCETSSSSFGTFWIVSGSVPERSRVNRSRSAPIRFGTVLVRSRVNVT